MSSPSDRVLGETNDVPSVMDVFTSVLEPIIITDTHARWVLENKGILSKDSVLQFQLKVPTAQKGKGFLPLGAGIYGLIKSAVLRCGATRINSIQDLAYFKTMTHSYDSPSFRTNVTRLLKGINNSLIPAALAPDLSGAGTFIPAGVEQLVEGEAELDYQLAITDSGDDTPCFSIRLSELFPVLLDIELPLFMLNDEVAIELTFNTQNDKDQNTGGVGTICCFKDNAGAADKAACNIVKESCLLYLDTITYNNERMEEVAASVNAREGLFLDFTDVIQNFASIPAIPSLSKTASEMTSQTRTHQLPLSGFQVKNVFWGYHVQDNTPKTTPATTPPTDYRFYNELLGKYQLLAYQKDDSWDIRVNDMLILPQSLESATMKAAECENVYGSQVWLNQGLYSFNPMVNKTGLHAVNANGDLFPAKTQFVLFGGSDTQALRAGQHFAAVNLSHGWGDDNDDAILIDSKPIEVIHNTLPVSPDFNFDRVTYYFSEVVKRLGVKDGKVQIFQQPAVQTSRQ